MKIKTRICSVILLILVLVLTLGFSSCKPTVKPDPDDPIVPPDDPVIPIIETDTLNITESGSYTINNKYVQINISAPNVTLTSGNVPFINITSGSVTLNSVTSARAVLKDNVHLIINENSNVTKVEVDGNNSSIELSHNLEELLVVESASNTSVKLNEANIGLVGLASKATFTGNGQILTVVTDNFSYYDSKLPVDYIAYEKPPYVTSGGNRSTASKEKPVVQANPVVHTHSYTINLDGYLSCSSCNEVFYSPFIAFLGENNELLTENIYLLTSDIYSVGVGIEYNNTTKELNYVNEGEARKVIIRTNGGTLNVDAPNDTLKHFGNLNNLHVEAIKSSSYYEKGVVAIKATLVSGRIEVETDGYIKEVDTTAAVAGSSLTVNGYVSTVKAAEGEGAIIATSGTGYVADNNGTPMGNVSTLDTNIASVADLLAFRDKVNTGYPFAGLTVKLTADLDISNIPWAPIGNNGHSFVGTFDGQGHTITGLTNNGYSVSSSDIFTTDHANTTGAPYGFFGVIGGSTGTTVTIKNLTLKNINIDMSNAGIIGGLFAADPKSAKIDASITDGVINIENINVYGQITSTNKSGVSMGGVAGKVYNPGRSNFVNCNSYVNVTSTEATGDLKVAGIVGLAAYGTFVVNNCNNYGNVTLSTSANIFTAGIITKTSGTVYVNGCKTQGKFDLETTGSDKEVFFSIIGRGQNQRSKNTGTTITFEDTTYNVYDDFGDVYNEPLPTKIYGTNCSISSDSSYEAFKATIKDNNNTLEITSSYEGLDMFKLYNNYPNY